MNNLAHDGRYFWYYNQKRNLLYQMEVKTRYERRNIEGLLPQYNPCNVEIQELIIIDKNSISEKPVPINNLACDERYFYTVYKNKLCRMILSRDRTAHAKFLLVAEHEIKL